jgi:hypothetical protein
MKEGSRGVTEARRHQDCARRREQPGQAMKIGWTLRAACFIASFRRCTLVDFNAMDLLEILVRGS